MTDLTRPHSSVRATEVRGTEVYNREGEHLGHIDDFVIGKRDGRVQYVIMSFGGFLGIGEDYHPLPWDALHYDEGMHGFVVGLTREQLEGAPRYPREREPDWDDLVWGRTIYNYYGVPPYF